MKGWPAQAPFDRIIVTAAAAGMPETLLAQLAVGGIMVLPLGLERADQELVETVRRLLETEITTEKLCDVYSLSASARYPRNGRADEDGRHRRRHGRRLCCLPAVAALRRAGSSGRYGSVVQRPSSGHQLGDQLFYIAVSGDTVDSVAQLFGVPVQSLIDANHLAPPLRTDAR